MSQIGTRLRHQAVRNTIQLHDFGITNGSLLLMKLPAKILAWRSAPRPKPPDEVARQFGVNGRFLAHVLNSPFGPGTATRSLAQLPPWASGSR